MEAFIRSVPVERAEGLLRRLYVALRPHETARADVDALKAVGLDDRAILDAVHVVGFFAYANRLVDGLGVPLEPERPVEPPWK